MRWVSKKLSYANVMSSLAVFLVLGGATAFAATHLGRNSVGAAQLKAGAVTAAKIHAQAVTGAKIADGSITGSDIQLNTLPSVPKAASVAGQESFSFFAPEPVEKVVTHVGSFRLIAFCGGGVGHTSGISLASDTDGTTVTKVGSPGPAIEIGPHIGGAAVISDDGSKPGILTGDSEWFATDVGGSGKSVSVSHLAIGLDVDGHPGECFFAGTIEELSQPGI